MSIKENNNNNNNETDPRFYDIEHCLELPTSKIYDIESGSMCISDFEGTGSSLPQKHSEHIMSKEDTKDELLIAQEAAIVTRLQKLDKVNRQRLRDEKEKSALCTATEIKRLKTEFFKHRQAIESYIQERGAIVRKKYGHNIKGKNAQSKMLVTISSAPIPIEVRVHFIFQILIFNTEHFNTIKSFN